ncbi:MAG TPA: hypothetical protein VET90_05285 [Candidatus Binatus sp.]|nr:hypothetical protein [Candidatus Binatus sp.]
MSVLTARFTLRRIRPAAAAAAAIAVVVGSYGLAAWHAALSSATSPQAVDPAALKAAPPPPIALSAPGGSLVALDGLQQIDHAIGIWTANLSRESRDFYASDNLGLLYEARARLTGDVEDYDRARQSMEHTLTIVPNDITARVVHARVLASLHEFPLALAEAQAIIRDTPGQLAALGTLGDAQLELGDVAGAAASYQRLAKAAPGNEAVDARLSRLAFIEGRSSQAWQLAMKAYTEAVADGATGPGLSWYAYVLGTLSLTAGQPRTALDWFGTAARDWPGSFLALGGEARAQAALGETAAAIHDDLASIAISPQPDTLTQLGDLYALSGQTKLADAQYATVEAIGQLQLTAQVFNRQLALFSINHDRDLAQALSMAQQELAARKDVYGYDTLSWALLANGQPAQAEVAIQQARAFGTQDPLIAYHAGMIDAALGRTAQARAELTQALAATGAIDPLATSRAQAVLLALP